MKLSSMHPKAPLDTTSSNSATSKAPLRLDTPIQYLKGVGPKIATLLSQKGINSIRDALFYFPRDYQDRSSLRTISSLLSNETVLIQGKIIKHGFIPIPRLKKPILEAKVQDASGMVSLKWFHYNRSFIENKLKKQPSIRAYGTVKAYGSKLELVHPDIEWDTEDEELQKGQGLLPIYSETEGLNQKLIRKIIEQALHAIPQLQDDLPEDVRNFYKLAPIEKAVRSLHQPEESASLEALRNFKMPEQQRLIFEELFKFEWVVGRRRLHVRREATQGYPQQPGFNLLKSVITSLPFILTDDQKASIEKIYEDLAENKPMNRLLQGDVGCGKTLVAFCASLPVLAYSHQAALMAPTEILADQHYKNALRVFEGISNINVGLLTGSTPKAKREGILADLASGKINFLIGTHALLEDPVRFKALGLVVIDEQHRFGVDQRMKLRNKGHHPHVLSMTATPIPRTLALTAYGDLDVTTIRQLPSGRPQLHTKIFKPSDRMEPMRLILEELKKNRQAYVIYPLVEESEKIDLANAVSGAEELANGVFRDYRVGILHGKMKPQDKTQVMDQFKQGKINVLVSTTVVEVGVDVPNSTVLMIENAERFGLSQLHQLRGRVGRGTETSYCFLIASGASPVAYDRLKAMEETRDGFRLAELDLEIRGPGEFLGTRQSGELQFKYANLVRDQAVLHEARKAAFELLKKDPDLSLAQNLPFRLYMERTGHLEQRRFETA